MSDTEKNDINDHKEVNDKKDLSDDTSGISINEVNDDTNNDAFQKSEEPEPELPREFICPITLCVMRDPVVTKDGQTYERAAIEEWFTRHRTSPTSNIRLTSTEVIPNLNLKNLIEDFLTQNPNCSTFRLSRASSQSFFVAQTENLCCKSRRSDRPQQEDRNRCTIL